jgi:hypothetical protein
MDEQRAQRTLVKSPPELWAEISDVDALARHLGEFGEISITRTEPETAVAWEGDRARGTVELEPAGWGTKVTLTAVPLGRLAAAAEPVGAEPDVAEPESDEAAEPERPEPAPQRAAADAEADPEAQAAADAEVAPEAALDAEPEPALDAEPELALDAEPEPELTRRGLWARFVAFWRGPQDEQAAPEATSPDDGCAPSPPEVPRDAEAAAPASPAPLTPESLRPAPPEPLRAAPAPVTPAAGLADPARTAAILVEVLDDLGAARHRPFSRMG